MKSFALVILLVVGAFADDDWWSNDFDDDSYEVVYRSVVPSVYSAAPTFRSAASTGSFFYNTVTNDDDSDEEDNDANIRYVYTAPATFGVPAQHTYTAPAPAPVQQTFYHAIAPQPVHQYVSPAPSQKSVSVQTYSAPNVAVHPQPTVYSSFAPSFYSGNYVRPVSSSFRSFAVPEPTFYHHGHTRHQGVVYVQHDDDDRFDFDDDRYDFD